jgi:hypothetical protein
VELTKNCTFHPVIDNRREKDWVIMSVLFFDGGIWRLYAAFTLG